MGRMVTVEEWAEIHGKTPAAVRRMIRKCVWKKAQNVLVDGQAYMVVRRGLAVA
mgnify:CR=1 FL=1